MAFALIFRIFHSDRTVMKRILFISFAVALGLNLNAQDECENPDLNCDGFVNVNDLLGMLSYFGDEEDGQWLDGDDCFSPDVNCDGFVNVNDLLVLLSSFGEQDLDGDGIWDSEDDCVCAIEGCTDIGACNFDPLALEDDGSCFVTSDWIQQGADIGGEAAHDQSGWSVSLSSDGTTVAIGARYNDGNGTFSGHVRVYAWNSATSAWEQQGADIDGEAVEDESGRSVSLSSDGTTVAVGAVFNDDNGSGSGHVRVYAWNSTTSAWEQQGADIDGEAAGDYSGNSVSLSSDGMTVAIGARYNDGNGTFSGHVRIYAWNSATSVWEQQGADIDGEAEYDYSGYNVSLSSDGTTVAIGAESNDGNGPSSGHVRIYAWDSATSAWEQQGADMDGEAAGDQSGTSVSLSSDGTTVAIGAPYNTDNGIYPGHVRIYAWNSATSAWEQQGADIDGEAANDYSGISVSLSSDGTTVAIGAHGNDSNGSDSGHVRIYSFSCPQIVEGCTDENAANYNPEATSDDGSCIIYGCPFTNACNYDPDVNSDDGSCVFYCPGCTDEVACNYDSEALQEDGSCEYPFDLYGFDYVDCAGQCLSDEDGDGICLEDEIYGCTEIEACNFNGEATENNGSCEFQSCAGCMYDEACNFDPEATLGDASCEYESCAGCMYEFACNYDPAATIADNGSCEFGTCPCCTDPEACNYNPTVTEDDGGCEYPVEYYDCFEECLNDVNGNGVCDEIEILGCMDQGACNFNDLATVNDGSCLFADWGLLGFELNGEASWESSASSVSISYDGSVIAIGSPGATNTEGVAAGQVRVFEWVSEQSAWTQKGDGIYGLGGSAQLGSSVSLSDDGNTLAVGAPYSDPDQNSGWHGSVGIYSWNDEMGQWIQQGDDIWGLEGDRAGYSVSLSSDGNSVVVGSPYNDDNGSDSGNVRVFQWDVFTSSWVQKGSNIVGEAEADNSGWSVSLSSNANTVAIGARFNAVNGNESGHVRIYYWLDSLGDWIQMGADIDSESEWDQFGHSVSLSSDGTIVAIGGQSNDSNGQDAGHVKVYQWVSEMLLWLQMGDDILGENIGDESGWSVSLSDDGNTLAVGSPGNDDSASDSGHVRIFHWDYEESNWTQQGTAIEGEAAVDRSGKSVAISGDGSTVLIGSPENDNSFFQAGQARVFIFGCN